MPKIKVQPEDNRFWNFKAAAGETSPPELILYGDISKKTWWGDEVTPQKFSEELSALGNVPEMIVRINSGGGDVFAANAIYTRLKDHPAKITVKIDGWAASAATIIAMAGDVIEIPANGIFMVHEAQMGLCGYYGKDDFAKLQEEIAVINNSIVNGYALKTGKSCEEIAAIMAATTWYDGKQAVEAGFCDRLMFGEAQTKVENASKIIVNQLPLDLGRFPDFPISLLNRLTFTASNCFSNTTTQKECNNMDIKTIADLKTAYPDLTAQVIKAAVNEERARIQAIEGVALAGFEEMIRDAKFTTPMNAGDVAQRIIAEQKKQGVSYLAARDADAQNSGTADVGAGVPLEGIAGKPGPNEIDAAIDKLFPQTK